MTIQELIDELKKYDPTMEVVTADGYNGTDVILEVLVKDIDLDDGYILYNETKGSQKMLVLGWNI